MKLGINISKNHRAMIRYAVEIVIVVLLIWNLVATVKYSEVLKPCNVKYSNGTEVETGLYGKCRFLEDYCPKVPTTQFTPQNVISVLNDET